MIDCRLKTIAEHYGSATQQNKCVEELGELIVALQKYKLGQANIHDVATEIADVHIMLDQIQFFLGINSQVEDERERKINRQIERMEQENE